MSVTVTWNATDITNKIDWNSLDAVSVLTKEHGTFKFAIVIKPETSAYVPALADTISLTDSSGKIFAGTVTEIQKRLRGGTGLALEAQITVTDFSYALDSKLVKASYTNEDPADILNDLVTRFGPGGFNATTHVQRAGFNIASISFNYQQLTRCIEKLARQIGWDWYVDPDKYVHFFYATTSSGTTEAYPAPITIDDTSAAINWPTLDVDYNITNLKNSIYVIGGSYKKEFDATTTPDVYTTVAGTTVYQLAYKYTGAFFVTLDGVVQSIGIDQQDDPGSFQTLYNGTGPFIRFTSDPGTGHTLKVYGFALIPIVAHVQDSASIAQYGEYQDSINDPQITTVQEAQERAQADLAQYGHAVYDVKFDTLSTGLRVGQTIVLNSTIFGVANYSLIIKRIEAKPFTPTKLKYSIEAVGSDIVTYNDIMLRLLQQQNAQNNVDPSTVLQILLNFEEGVTVLDTSTATGTSRPYKWNSGSPQIRWGFWTWS